VVVTGTVRAVGPEAEGLKPGDRVMIAQHTQQGRDGSRRVMKFPDIVDEGVTCIFCDYSEILGVVK
jgi:threonine dehydrogenase-like Zn-dependent dehydrogenase